MKSNLRSILFALACLLQACHPAGSHAQLAPGPYEILPFDDGFIIEAFKDLDDRSGTMADWTGWAGTDAGFFLVSPHPYDGHIGTDYSVQTGTPLRAAAAGTISGIVTNYARNQHDDTYGNFVRIAVDTPSPNGELLDLTYCHMLSVSVSVGQHVSVGDLVGLSDNSGDSDSEHVHFMTELRGLTNTCPFYWAHFKYPIMFNPTGTLQVGRVVRIAVTNAPIRTDHFDTSPQISTAWQNQLYFSSYPKRGYYQIFIPNNASYRSGWVRASDAEEVFTGTMVQTLPDNVAFTPLGPLASPYALRSSPDNAAPQIAQLLFGGGRFVADQITNGFYRVPIPGALANWGWVKPNNRMVVYPQLTNPSLALSQLPKTTFPLHEPFATVGKSMFGRPKFNRSVVKAFSPSSPGGDGNALFITDATNAGTGTSESVTVGQPGHTDYYVQCDVYFNYRPAYLVTDGGFERYGIFLRDDGFAGLDTEYEGAGNAYGFLWDADDGRLRAAKMVEGVITDLFPVVHTVAASGWHTMRIEGRGSQLKFFLDGQLQLTTTDITFPSGVCGIGYTMNFNGFPAGRGAYFDNFAADTLNPAAPRFEKVSLQSDGTVHMQLTGDVGSTSVVDRATSLDNWTFYTNVAQTSRTMEFSDQSNSPSRFYRARRLP